LSEESKQSLQYIAKNREFKPFFAKELDPQPTSAVTADAPGGVSSLFKGINSQVSNMSVTAGPSSQLSQGAVDEDQGLLFKPLSGLQQVGPLQSQPEESKEA